MIEMPYKRDDGCDLCGARGPLRRVMLAPGGQKKLARVAYICGAHGDPSGPVLRTPHTRRAEGTTNTRPQSETLW